MAISYPRFTSAKCLHCGTWHDHVPIEWEPAGDRDAEYVYGHAALETEHCSAFGCRVKLCPACPQTECAGCHLPFCERHPLTDFGGDLLCPACMAEVLDEAAELAAEEETANA